MSVTAKDYKQGNDWVDVAVNGVCSIVEAIVNANDGAQTHVDCVGGEAGLDTVTLAPASLYSLLAEVDESTRDDRNKQVLPNVTAPLVIEGNGSTIEYAGDTDRFGVLEVTSSGNLTVDHATIRGSVIHAIHNLGTLTLTRVTLTESGGGLRNFGTATLTHCTISENVSGLGGGILNEGGVLTMTNCTISGNGAAGFSGGGLYNIGTATLRNCTVTKNWGGNSNGANGPGSGILSSSLPGVPNPITLVNTLVSGNLPGVIDENGEFILIYGPDGTYRGGTEIADFSVNVPLAITTVNSIFGHAGLNDVQAFGGISQFQPGPSDINATSDGANIPLEQILDETLRLNFPGETETHALPKGSPAIDYGLDCAALATDQRGVSRAIDGDGDGTIGCDVGAYEFSCGNGIIDASAGEECDDGNTVEDDLCLSDCTLQCGDGELDPGEQCDDGNDDSNDGCAFCRRGDPVLEDDDESGATNEPAPPADDDEGSAVP